MPSSVSMLLMEVPTCDLAAGCRFVWAWALVTGRPTPAGKTCAASIRTDNSATILERLRVAFNSFLLVLC